MPHSLGMKPLLLVYVLVEENRCKTKPDHRPTQTKNRPPTTRDNAPALCVGGTDQDIYLANGRCDGSVTKEKRP